MVKLNNKKGAIEMSLNLIIMLIIGMVVLGLVIGFVNSLVSKGTDSFDKQLGDNEKLKLDEVKACPENLCVNPYPAITIKKGDDTNMFIKVRAFSEEISCPAGELNDKNCQVTYEVLDNNGDLVPEALIIVGQGFSGKDGDDTAGMYSLKATTDSTIGTYYLTFKVYADEEFEESKTITVEVK